jgi:hypothetical protein
MVRRNALDTTEYSQTPFDITFQDYPTPLSKLPRTGRIANSFVPDNLTPRRIWVEVPLILRRGERVIVSCVYMTKPGMSESGEAFLSFEFGVYCVCVSEKWKIVCSILSVLVVLNWMGMAAR